MKRNFLMAVAGLVLGTTVPAAHAVGYDLRTCMFSNGLPMHPIACESLKKKAAEEAANAQRYDERQAVNRARQAEQQAIADAKEQELQRQREAQQAKWKAERDEEQAMGLKAQQEQIQWEKATAKAASARVAKQKSACGEDYRSPRIGMTISRAKECVADFRLQGQINRADGVVSTYTAGRMYLHVMDGKIVSWGR